MKVLQAALVIYVFVGCLFGGIGCVLTSNESEDFDAIDWVVVFLIGLLLWPKIALDRLRGGQP